MQAANTGEKRVIDRIRIEGFKSLEGVDLTLGHLNLFIGTNASGKSNFLEALRLLQGIGYGFSISEVLNGKPKSFSSEVWEGIRGGSARAAFVRKTEEVVKRDRLISLSVEVPPDNKLRDSADETIRNMRRSQDMPDLTPQDPWHIEYSIEISPSDCRVRSEKLGVSGTKVFYTSSYDNTPESATIRVRCYPAPEFREHVISLDRSLPVLQQLRRGNYLHGHDAVIEFCMRALSNMQRLEPSPTILRDYSQAQTVRRMGERGENFASLINAIQSEENTKSAYVSWLKQLTPTEVDDVTVLKGALGEPLFAIKEGVIVYPAPILSDGTLRFAAITAAFFQPDMPDILAIEEIENGIHPSRLRLLVEMLRSQASLNRQVLATTHSPVILAWLNPDDYKTTFLCTRDEETGASKIVPLTQVPNLENLVKKQSIGELFTEGWLEEAL